MNAAALYYRGTVKHGERIPKSLEGLATVQGFDAEVCYFDLPEEDAERFVQEYPDLEEFQFLGCNVQLEGEYPHWDVERVDNNLNLNMDEKTVRIHGYDIPVEKRKQRLLDELEAAGYLNEG